jgi:hypothetical protein
MRFLFGEEAVDIARMTDVELEATWDPRGGLVRVIDMKRLDWWDAMKVTLARIACYHYLDSQWASSSAS